MAQLTSNGFKKRKKPEEAISAPRSSEFVEDVGLEMQSEDEDGADEVESSDDEGAERFPELDTRSDSEGEEDEESQAEDEDEDGNETEPSADGTVEEDSDDSLHVFPRAKTITSDITGQPKKVYPEIEPDYDSDSSTEEVSHNPALIPYCTNFLCRIPIVLETCPCTGTMIFPT